MNHYLIKNKNGNIIGRVCALYINKKVYVSDLYFKNVTPLQIRKVLGYFERTYLKETNPVKVIIIRPIYKEDFRKLGYKKDKEGLSKLVYAK